MCSDAFKLYSIGLVMGYLGPKISVVVRLPASESQ